ncbi:MAG: four helix bundle protein [Anaerolineae bacterium]|nr:four helix bundle protein [Anaerolineae bacterium]
MDETKKFRDYRDLLIWQKGLVLVKAVYQLTKKFPNSEIYALSSQVQRAAVSIPSNIAEGQCRQHQGEFKQFLYIALGSSGEVDTQMIVAEQLGYISQDELTEIHAQIEEIRRLIRGLVAKL